MHLQNLSHKPASSIRAPKSDHLDLKKIVYCLSSVICSSKQNSLRQTNADKKHEDHLQKKKINWPTKEILHKRKIKESIIQINEKESVKKTCKKNMQAS